MHRFIALPVLLGILFIFSSGCSRNDGDYHGKVLKGKFLIQGVCSNYTIQLLEGYIPPEKIVASWKVWATDSIAYSNVFAVANVCNFDKYKLQQGDVFTFELGTTPGGGCTVCLAYFPTPPIYNSIKNVKKVN